MADWLNLFRRQRIPTIGDIIAGNINRHPDSWEVSRVRALIWEYENKDKGWKLVLVSSLYSNGLSFDQCSLTDKEEGRILKAIYKMSKDRSEKLRETTHRRMLIRAVL